jgi:transcriptional regulator with XRE-family HTH domain
MVMEQANYATLLQQYVARSGYTPGQLARKAGVPKMTIVHWLRGEVKRPRHALELVQLAQALRLDLAEVNDLLSAAGHASLSELYARVHSQDEKALLATWLAPEQANGHLAPFQAPPNPPLFAGREAELQSLGEQLRAASHSTPYLLIGTTGVGKTALAARLAYRLRPHLPDGVLWARLDSSDPMTILQLFADAYGRDVTGFADLHSRSQAVRGLLARKRALIVLDNVRESEPARPFLPPSGPCALLLISRRHDLAIARSARRTVLEPFNAHGDEALALFTQVLGEERVRAEQTVLRKLADLLGHLPLALEIAAYRLAHEPGLQTGHFLSRLRHERERLDQLAYGQKSVRAAFVSSYALLTPAQQAVFAALGQLPNHSFTVAAAATAAGLSPAAAGQQLQRLHALSLVHEGRHGRYRLLPLLHQFARELDMAENL